MIWLVLRIALMVVGLVEGNELAFTYQTTLEGLDFAGVLALVALIAAICVMLPTTAARWRSGNRGLWHRPGWKGRFLVGEPLQVFHIAAWYFIAMGASGILTAIVSRQASVVAP